MRQGCEFLHVQPLRFIELLMPQVAQLDNTDAMMLAAERQIAAQIGYPVYTLALLLNISLSSYECQRLGMWYCRQLIERQITESRGKAGLEREIEHLDWLSRNAEDLLHNVHAYTLNQRAGRIHLRYYRTMLDIVKYCLSHPRAITEGKMNEVFMSICRHDFIRASNTLRDMKKLEKRCP